MNVESLATRLKALREREGLTKYRLAKLSGISEVYLYRLEQGEIKNPRRDTLQKLAKGLSITLAQLIGETSPSETWGMVEISLKAYIPVYAEVGKEMNPIDYVACTRATVPPETVCGYRIDSLYLDPEVRPGDTIIVDTALSPIDGDLVIAIIEKQPMLKRYRENGHEEQWLEDNEGRCGVKGIHGVVTECVRKMR